MRSGSKDFIHSRKAKKAQQSSRTHHAEHDGSNNARTLTFDQRRNQSEKCPTQAKMSGERAD
jgi:hypothetical protein